MPTNRVHQLTVGLLVIVGLLLMGLVGFVIASADAASVQAPELERISATSGSNSSDHKYVTAKCSDGKLLIGTGGAIAGGAGQVEMDDIAPRESQSPSGFPASVRVYAYETDPYAGNWKVTAYAICAPPVAGVLDGLEWKMTTTSTTSDFGKSATVACPSTKKLLGLGGHVEGGLGEVLMNHLTPNGSLTAPPTKVEVGAFKSDRYSGKWRLTAHALCANSIPRAGLVRIEAASPNIDVNNKSATAECPPGKRVVGTGADLSWGIDQEGGVDDYVISSIVPFETSVTATAYEEDPISGQWSVHAYAICGATS